MIKPNKLYLCKNGSPLVLGIDNKIALVSSEQLSLSSYFNNYITLNDGDIITITRSDDGSIKFPNKVNYIENQIQNNTTKLNPIQTYKKYKLNQTKTKQTCT